MSNLNSIPYVLVANIIIDERRKKDFEGAVSNFFEQAVLAGGERHMPFVRVLPTCKHKLRLALRGSEPFELKPESEKYGGGQHLLAYVDSGPAPESCRRYVHVWDVPDLQSLDIAAVMRAIADDESYMKIDAQVFRESQIITAPVQWPTGLSPLDPPSDRAASPCFVRIDRSFSTAQVGVYLFGLRALMTLMAAGDGTRSCRLVSHVQDVTGRLNTSIEFWQASPEGKDGFQTFQDLVEYWKEKQPDLMSRIYDSWAAKDVQHRFGARTYTLASYF